MRLKAIKIQRLADGRYRVTPIFYGNKGSSVEKTDRAEVGHNLTEVATKVIERERPVKNPVG